MSSIFGGFRNVRVFPLVLGLVAALLLVQTVRLVWTIVTPLGPVGDWRASEVKVLPPQSRLALFKSFDPFFRTDPVQSGNVVTSLQLTLYGIRMNAGSGLGSAILAGQDGVQESYAVGEDIRPGVSLASVQFDHITIDRGGVMESLYLDQSVPAETVGTRAPVPSNIGLAPSGALAAPFAESISSAIGFQPRSADGKITGIILSPQGDGAMFRSAGFRDGDIITAVEGKPVSSAADIAALKSQIVPGTRISVEVERGAKTVPISINLPGQ